LGTTAIGVELRKEFLASNNLGSRERFVTQVFVEHHFSFFQDKFHVSPGLSWANYDTEGNFFYPGLDAGFDMNEYHKIYGNIAKVNRVPTFTDLYYVSKTETGNPNLLPENAVSAELGYRFQKNNFLAKVSGFLRNSNNAIDWTKQNQNDIWRAENIGKIETKGLEVEVAKNFNSFIKSYSVGYTYLDSKSLQTTNLISRYILENLKHQFVAKLENKFLKNFTNQLIYRYNERVTTGSYQLLDEKLSYDLKKLNIYILIIYYNLLNFMSKSFPLYNSKVFSLTTYLSASLSIFRKLFSTSILSQAFLVEPTFFTLKFPAVASKESSPK
jgi:iron complex outermembrane receptor protein